MDQEWIDEFEALDTTYLMDLMYIDDEELLDNFMDDIINLLEEIE